MLRDSQAFQGFAVPDVPAAQAFYADTLGLDVEEQDGMLRLHLGGGRDTIVYPKPDHTPATYTILNFPSAGRRGRCGRADRARRALRALRGDADGDRRQGRVPRWGAAHRLVHGSGGNVLSVIEE